MDHAEASLVWQKAAAAHLTGKINLALVLEQGRDGAAGAASANGKGAP